MPYHAHMLASGRHGALYLGATNNLARRVQKHRSGRTPGFTAVYGVTRLVWHAAYDRVTEAITRERMLKNWPRA